MTDRIGTTLDDCYLWRAVSNDVNEVLKLLLEPNKPLAAFNLGLFAREWSVFAMRTQKP